MSTPPPRAPRFVCGAVRLLVARAEREDLLAELRAASPSTSGPRWWAGQLFGLLRPSVLWRLGVRPRLSRLAGRAPGRFATSSFDEIRHGLRSVRRNGRVSAAAIVILGIGIGAATTLFAVLDAIVLSPLPHPEGDRLVSLIDRNLDQETIAEWREDRDLFDGLAGFAIRQVTVRAQGSAEVARVMPVTEDFLPLLAGRATDGRLLVPSDHDPSSPPAAVVRRPFWERRFGDEWVPDRVVELDGRSYTVVGTLPASFQFGLYRDVDVWHPFEDPTAGMDGVGRLAEGVDIAAAAREIERRAAARAQEMGAEAGPGAPAIRVVRLKETVVGDVRTVLWLLFGTTGLVLLLSCANAANLFLARLLERRDELTVRVAMGAGPARLLGLLLGEGAIISILAAVLGIGLAVGVIALLAGPAAASLPRAGEISVDGGVLGFSILVTSLTVLLFALGPALGALRRTSLTPGSLRATGGRRSGRLRSGLVVLQVALALVLGVGTSLLVRTFVQLNPTDPGFAVEGRVVASFDLPAETYADPNRTLAFVEALARELEGSPEVRRAETVYFLPLTGLSWALRVTALDGRPTAGDGPLLHVRAATPGLLDLLEIPVLEGAGLEPFGDEDAPIAIINGTAARRFWRGTSPIGKRLTLPNGPDGADRIYTVTGVARDTRIFGSDTRDRPVAYIPFAAAPERRFQVVLDVAPGVSFPRERLDAAVAAVDPAIPVDDYSSLRDLIAPSVRLPRFQASVMSALGSLGLILAVAGCFAVLSFLVTARRREMGIRIALGASQGRILTLVLGHGGLLVGTGLLLGVAACAASTRLLEGMLYGLSPLDPMSYAIAIVALAASAGLAILWPALRAAAVSPATALREE